MKKQKPNEVYTDAEEAEALKYTETDMLLKCRVAVIEYQLKLITTILKD